MFIPSTRTIFLTLCLATSISSQTPSAGMSQRQAIQNRTAEVAQRQGRQKEEAVAWARARGLAVRQELPNGAVMELMSVENNSPRYYITNNLNAAKTVSTDKVWPSGGLGLSLTGSGLTIGEWDGGDVLTTHDELTGRVTDGDGTGTRHWHSTHVAGTIMATGVIASAKGMAYQASLKAFEWTSDVTEMRTAANDWLTISNHSYGTIAGWYYDGSDWWWYGNNNNTGIDGTEDWQFGAYDTESQDWDQAVVDFPYYLIVVSAGNDRDDDPGAGTTHFVWDGFDWVTSTTTRDPDGPYDSIPRGGGTAKNTLTVGAVNDITGGYSDTSDVVMSTFSSWGPMDDGRIKPDIVANGVSLTSAYDDGTAATNLYASASGTSMAAPSTTGSLALLQQHYQDTHAGADIKAAALKALVIHTADEAGVNDGPDYQFGWGLLNTASAAQLISDTQTNPFTLQDSTILAGGADTISYNISVGTGPLRVTVVWTDPAGTPLGAVLNNTTPMLVNDLDLRVTRDSDGTLYYPWKLDVANPSNVATTGDNIVDNVEQVHIASPESGDYTVTVSHKGTLASAQDFSIVITVGNYAPTISDIADTFTNVNETTSAIAFTVDDVETDVDSLAVTGSSSNTTLVPDSSIVFGGSGTDLTVTIIPAAEEFGTTTITIFVSDGTDTTRASFLLTVNVSPVAVDDAITTAEDTAATVFVLANDLDPDSLSLTVESIVEQARHGEVVIDAGDTTLTYTPVSDYFGGDTLEYRVSDGYSSDTAVVYVTVSPVNDPPAITSAAADTAREDEYFVYHATTSDPDGPSLSWTFDQLPSWLFWNTGADTVFGIPADGINDTLFRMISFDGELRDTLVVTLKVIPVNDAPSVFALLVPADGDTATIANDSLYFAWESAADVDSDNLTYTFYLFGPGLDTSLSGLDTSFSFTGVDRLTPESIYTWYVDVNDGTDTTECSLRFQFSMPISLGINPASLIPGEFTLHQNYPNPFNPATTIRFGLPEAADIKFIVYDLLGREVDRLVDQRLEPGYYKVAWQGRDAGGHSMPSGIYIALLATPKYTKSIKLLLLK